MPVQTWICPNCSCQIADQYHPSSSAILACPNCSLVMDRSWARDSRPLFRSFTSNDGTGDRTFSSLESVRRYERETERKANGRDGQRIVFREYSQDHTNRDVNTLAKEGFQQHKPTKKSNVRRRPHVP